jgi:hypothetical protein
MELVEVKHPGNPALKMLVEPGDAHQYEPWEAVTPETGESSGSEEGLIDELAGLIEENQEPKKTRQRRAV